MYSSLKIHEKLQEEKSKRTLEMKQERSRTTERKKDHSSDAHSARQIFDEELKVQYTSNETTQSRRIEDLSAAPKT
jgi:hypothetical protein